MKALPGFPLVFAALLSAVSLAPYLLAYWLTPPGHHFAGFFFIADDAATYLSKMRQGLDGAWLWTDPYTSEPHTGVFLFEFYILFGKLAGLAHIPLIAAYHLARVSGAFALVLGVDALARRVLEPRLRRLAVVVAVLGSGLGFAVQALGDPSLLGQRLQALDLHLPEISGWYSILAIPHFAWAAALIAFSLAALLEIRSRPGWRWLLAASAALLALTAIHPQMLAVLGLVWLAYRAVLLGFGPRPSGRQLAAEALPFAVSLPLFLYSAWILYRDPVIVRWADQWRHQAPGFLSLLVGLGLPLLFAAYGGFRASCRKDRALVLMAVWPAVVLILLYLPNFANIQRRLIDGIYIPIGFLAAYALRDIAGRLSRAGGRRLVALAVPAFCLTSGIVLAIALRFATGAFPEAYVQNDTWDALTWLSTHHSSSDRLLSSPGVGLLAPAWSGVEVYVGHYSETLDYFAKIQAVDQVLSPGTSPGAQSAFMQKNGITLLIVTPQDINTLKQNPGNSPLWRLVHQQGQVSIYRFSGWSG